MSTWTTTTRHRLAWAVPTGAVLVVAAAVTIPMLASASPALPQRSAAQLLVDVSESAGTPLSGTVVQTARLGLPALPEVGGTSITPLSLLSGSHTARVWYDGADKARVALIGDLTETDLIRNGRDVWLWTSGANTAEHAELPAKTADDDVPATGTAESLTPAQATEQALAAIDPSTTVTVDGTASVAGRDAYDLVLQPRDTRSLVGDVRIAIDSETGVPLRVQVNAKGSSGRPAFETAFTSVSFSKPSADVFRFSPPPGAEVSDLSWPSRPDGVPKDQVGTSGEAPRVVGSGWTAVVELSRVPPPPGPSRSGDEIGAGGLAALTQAMTPVSGSFGQGQVLRTRLVSVLLLDDGRLLVGAVPPQVLEQAAVTR